MTAIALRKKVHKYVDDVEENVLEAVYKMLRIYVEYTITVVKQGCRGI